MRRRDAPVRRVAGQVILPRRDGQSALVFAGAAATVWVLLGELAEPADLARSLAAAHLELDEGEAAHIVASVVEALDQEGLVERAGP